MQNTINLVDVSTDGLYLVFCLSGQREVSGAKALAGLGSGQKLQGQSEQTGCRAPQGQRPRDSQLCCCDGPGRRADCWGHPGYSWDTYRGRRNSSSFSVVMYCLKNPQGSCSSLMIMVLGLTLVGPWF